MNILEMLLNADNGGLVNQLSQNFGISQDQTKSAVSNLLPALTGGIQRNIANPDGLGSLLNALGSGNHQRYLNDPAGLTRPESIQDGNSILGHILGSKDVSRQVASRASAQTGLDASMLKKMLPVVATLAMGMLSQGASKQGLLGGGAQAAQPQGALGMLGSLLDAGGDGSVVDDLLGIAKKFL